MLPNFTMSSPKLIQKVINGVILRERVESRSGNYLIKEILSVSNGCRNNSDGYWEQIREVGGWENHNSFYGDFGYPFQSPEQAAVAAISRRGIVAVDNHNRVIFQKNGTVDR